MNVIEDMVKTLRKIEEETGKPAPYIELTREQYAEFKKAVDAAGVLTAPCEVPIPDSFMGLTIRVKDDATQETLLTHYAEKLQPG